MRGVPTTNERTGRLRHWRRGDAAAPPPPSVALQASILVLNRLYMAVHVIGVRRGFALLCRELAEVIHHEDGVFTNYTFEFVARAVATSAPLASRRTKIGFER